MGRYRITRDIDATPEQVFRAFTDPALVADWMDFHRWKSLLRMKCGA